MTAQWKIDNQLEDFLEENYLIKKMSYAATMSLMRSTFGNYTTCSQSTLVRMLKHFGLSRQESQCSDEDLVKAMREIWDQKGENAVGIRMMTTIMRTEKKLVVTRRRVESMMKHLQPGAVASRQPSKKRKRLKGFFDCSGPNLLWSCDGNDKLSGYQKSTFDIHIYGIMDVYSRKILLLKALQGNSNPLAIGRLYADLVKSMSLVPRRIRLDKGTETVEMALIQATLLHEMGIDQSKMEGCIYGPSITNKIERFWRSLREKVLDQYRDFFTHLKNERLYRQECAKERQLLSAIFIPFVQRDLDSYKEVHNNHPIQTQRELLLPTGLSPEVLYNCPDLTGAEDHAVQIDETAISAIDKLSSGVCTHPLGIDVHTAIQDRVVTHFQNLTFEDITPREVTMEYITLVKRMRALDG